MERPGFPPGGTGGFPGGLNLNLTVDPAPGPRRPDQEGGPVLTEIFTFPSRFIHKTAVEWNRVPLGEGAVWRTLGAWFSRTLLRSGSEGPESRAITLQGSDTLLLQGPRRAEGQKACEEAGYSPWLRKQTLPRLSAALPFVFIVGLPGSALDPRPPRKSKNW
jgi:hypothetical protein